MSDAVQYNLSEVNTEYEDIQKSKRKSRARKINIFSSSEDESNDDSNKLINDYPTPPKIQPSMAISIQLFITQLISK